MSALRLYVDEDAAEQAVLEGLRIQGFDLLTVYEAESAGDSDREQLLFAASLGRAMYTLNVADFCRLHQEFVANRVEHAGVIVIPRQRHSIGEKIRRLSLLIRTVTAEAIRNQLIFV